MILLADVGGTNTRLALVEKPYNKFLKLKKYKSKNYLNFYKIVEKYLEEIELDQKLEIAFFAVAGPVIKQEVHLTNLNWKISVKKLKEKFGFKKIILVNDLYALSASILILKNKDLLVIKRGTKLKREPKAFIALGTGLGEAVLIKEKPLIILPSEGGHIFFSPLNEEEINYLKFLEKKQEELSWEKALSGKALTYWYEYYFNEIIEPEKISELAKNNHSKALKVIQKYFELLGRKISQLALYSLPEGGIYISGGVVQGLKEFFKRRDFKNKLLEGYFRNIKMRALLEKFSITLILHPNPTLLGALAILHNQLK